MEYSFYILYSERIDKLYIGHTSQLHERLKKHNRNHIGFTGKSDDWQLVHHEAYESKTKAYAREKQVKKWKSRIRIKALINANKD